MKSRFILSIIAVLFIGSVAAAAEEEARVEENKWYKGQEGYEEARLLQEKTNADIFLYFYRTDDKSQKGLCKWWEEHRLNTGKVKRHLRSYIKVMVQAPLRKREEETFREFWFNSCPSIFIVKPAGSTGYSERINVFDWPNNKPKLKEDDEIIALIEQAGSKKAEPSVAP